MNIAEEKARLKKEIDNINDPEVLHRISALLSNDSGSLMTEEQLAIVMKRREEYLRDPSSAIPAEELDAEIRRKYGF